MTGHVSHSPGRHTRRARPARLFRLPAALSYEFVDDQPGTNDTIRRAIERQTQWLTGYITVVAAVSLALWTVLQG